MVVIVLFLPCNPNGCDEKSNLYSTTSPLAFVDSNVKKSLDHKCCKPNGLYNNKQNDKLRSLSNLPNLSYSAHTVYPSRDFYKISTPHKEFHSPRISSTFQNHHDVHSREFKRKTLDIKTSKLSPTFSKPCTKSVPEYQQHKIFSHSNNKNSNISFTNQYNENKTENISLTTGNNNNSDCKCIRHVTRVNFYDIETNSKDGMHDEEMIQRNEDNAINVKDSAGFNKKEKFVTKTKNELTMRGRIETNVEGNNVVFENGNVINESDSILTLTESTAKRKTEAIEKCNLEERINFARTKNITGTNLLSLPYIDNELQAPTCDAETSLIFLYKQDNDRKEKGEKRRILDEVNNDSIETEISKPSGHFSDEAFLDVVCSGIKQWHKGILLSPIYEKKQPKSVCSRIITNSADSYKIIDIENTEKQYLVGEYGKEITVVTKTTRHKVNIDENLTNNINNNSLKNNEELIIHDKQTFNVVTNERTVNDEMKYSTDPTQMQNDSLEQPDDWDSSLNQWRKIRNPYHKTQPSHPQKTSILIDRKDALTKRPLDFDREEETRKGETIKWLESHFGSESTSSSNNSVEDEKKLSSTAEKTYFNITIKSNENPIIPYSLSVPYDSLHLASNKNRSKFSNRNIGIAKSKEIELSLSNSFHSNILSDDRHKLTELVDFRPISVSKENLVSTKPTFMKAGLTRLNSNKVEEHFNQKNDSTTCDFFSSLSQNSKTSLDANLNLSMLNRSFATKEISNSSQHPLYTNDKEKFSNTSSNLTKEKAKDVLLKRNEIAVNAKQKSENLEYSIPIKSSKLSSKKSSSIELKTNTIIHPRNSTESLEQYNKTILSFEGKNQVSQFPQYINLSAYQGQNFTDITNVKIKPQNHDDCVPNAVLKSSNKATTLGQAVGNSLLKLIRKFRSCKNEHKSRTKFKNRFFNTSNDNTPKFCSRDGQDHKDVNTTYQKYNVIDSHIGSVSLQSDYGDNSKQRLTFRQNDVIQSQPSQLGNLTSSLQRKPCVSNDVEFHFSQNNKQYYYLGEDPYSSNLRGKENVIEIKARNHLSKEPYNLRCVPKNSFNSEKPLTYTLDRYQKNKNHMSVSNPNINFKYNSAHTLPKQFNDEQFKDDEHTSQMKSSYSPNPQFNRKFSKTVQFDKYSRSLNRHKSISVHNMLVGNEYNQMYNDNYNGGIYVKQKYLPHSDCSINKSQYGLKSPPIINSINRNQKDFSKLKVNQDESINYFDKVTYNSPSPMQMNKNLSLRDQNQKDYNSQSNYKTRSVARNKLQPRRSLNT